MTSVNAIINCFPAIRSTMTAISYKITLVYRAAFVMVMYSLLLSLWIVATPLPSPSSPTSFTTSAAEPVVLEEQHPVVSTVAPVVVKQEYATLYSERGCRGLAFSVDASSFETNCDGCLDLCNNYFEVSDVQLHGKVQSVRVNSKAPPIDLHDQCLGTYSYKDSGYIATLYPQDGCVDFYGAKSFSHMKFRTPKEESIAVQLRKDFPRIGTNKKDFHVVHSCESSEYFGYQSLTNYHAFLKSQPNDRAEHTRLLTSSEPDDLMSIVPTFQARRHPFSKRYSPVNKPDSLIKWFAAGFPEEEIIVLIDPDNFLVRDMSDYVTRTTNGHPVAQAAWFHGNSLVQEIWEEFCEANCDWKVDAVGVPIVIHKDDLEAIAPLWRHYTILMSYASQSNHTFSEHYKNIQIGWGAEMLGYVAAAAHLGIRHEIERGMQMRDVDGRREKEYTDKIPMVHMGRAWVPPTSPLAGLYGHTEGKDFSRFGQQIWCKCNYTAADIIPWPLPDEGVDFVSRETITLMHEAMEKFGPIPKSKYRKQGKHGYHQGFQ